MKAEKAPITAREAVQRKFNSARSNLLLMIILTLVNVILYFVGTDSMLLFSATIPYLAALFGHWLAPSDIAVMCYMLAGFLIALYLLCWLLSKKRYVWLIIALVLFAVDTVVMVYFNIRFGDYSEILDVLIHTWVLYYLVIGVISGVKLKKLPPEEPVQPQEWPNMEK